VIPYQMCSWRCNQIQKYSYPYLGHRAGKLPRVVFEWAGEQDRYSQGSVGGRLDIETGETMWRGDVRWRPGEGIMDLAHA